MSLTYGFYNSVNHDRLYTAEQFGSLFDGVITDGVFSTVGDHFVVRWVEGLTVVVGSGRAWFEHTWTYNDSDYRLTLDNADLFLPRYDAIVLETNHGISARNNQLTIVKGKPATDPAYPTLEKRQDHYQHPLAYIYIRPSVLTLSQDDVISVIGTSACPFCTSILQQTDVDELYNNWDQTWRRWLATTTAREQKEIDDWEEETRTAFAAWRTNETNNFNSWKSTETSNFANWKSEEQASFYSWKTTETSNFTNWKNEETSAFVSWENQAKAQFDAWYRNIKDTLGSSGSDLVDGVTDLINRVKAIVNATTYTLSASGWSGSSYPYEQSITITGMTASEEPIFEFGEPNTVNHDTMRAYNKAKSYVDRWITQDGRVTFQCWSKKPAVDLKIRIRRFA